MAPPAYHDQPPRGKKPVLAILAAALVVLSASVVLFPFMVESNPVPGGSIVGGGPVQGSGGGPTASFWFNCDGLTCDFDASGSGGDHRIVRHAWTFGDGEDARGEFARHTYLEPGEYTVTLIVTDEEGDEDDATGTVRVRR